MTLTLRLTAAPTLAAAALAFLAAGAARAADPGPMPTAPAASSGAPPSVAAGTAQQINDYLRTSPAVTLPKDAAAGVTTGDEPRKIHGTVDVAVGTGGYRSAFVQSDIPVGKTGTVSIAVGETHFDGRARGGFIPVYGYGPGGRQSLALGLALGDAALDPRCRRTAEAESDLRDDPRLVAGHPRSCPAAGPSHSPD